MILPAGARFTIEGCSVGLGGKFLVNGRNIKTGRKCKSIHPVVFRVCEEVSGTKAEAPKIEYD
jgi:hypothetical protein